MAISEELQRRIAGFTGDMTAPTKGAISDQEMNMFQKSRMNMGIAPKGAISDQEMKVKRLTLNKHNNLPVLELALILN